MRTQVTKLLRYTKDCMLAHEQGEPYTTCLALRGQLQDALDGKVVLNMTKLVKLMDALSAAFDNVTMARQRALGKRITISFVTNSEEMDNLVHYLDFLKERGIAQDELDSMYVEAFQSSISGA